VGHPVLHVNLRFLIRGESSVTERRFNSLDEAVLLMERGGRNIEGQDKEKWINEGGFLVDVFIHFCARSQNGEKYLLASS